MLVSVIVPIYNAEKYLCQCLDSIINQTYEELDIILVDDGSIDRSGTICEEYAQRDCRIKVLHQTNQGCSAARNNGLMVAKGDAVFFVDADDWLAQDAVCRMIELLAKDQTDIVICDVAVEYDSEHYSGQQHEDESPLENGYLSRDEIVQKFADSQAWQYVTCNKMMRRKILEGVQFPESYVHEDAAIVHRLFGASRYIAITTERLYHYRQVDGSIMNSKFSIRRTDLLTALADRIQYSAEQQWEQLLKRTTMRYTCTFFDYYLNFPKTDEHKCYFDRMESSLKQALPYILRCSEVSIRHKVYLIMIRCAPQMFDWLRKLK